MAVEPGLSWQQLFAVRTRGDVGSGIAAIMAFSNAPGVISFSGGFPDSATVDAEAVARILRELVEAGDPSPFQYAPTRGLPRTLELVADRLEVLDGLRPAGDELLVTSGGMEALELAGKALLDPGDRVLVEAPTYLGAIMSFRSFEADVAAVALDADGLLVDELEDELARGRRPKLLYTNPDHQNPAGVTLSAERRLALVELARRHDLLLVEDVAYRELGFSGEHHASLRALAPERVLQIGTFSKTFHPGLRLGWAAGPAELVAELVLAKQTTDQCAAALGQRLLAEYGRRGHLDAQIERSRALYRRRSRLLLDALARHLGGRARWTEPEGGFFTWVDFGEGTDAVELARAAVERGVAIVPGAPFFPDGRGVHQARLSFSHVADDDVDAGVERLARLLP